MDFAQSRHYFVDNFDREKNRANQSAQRRTKHVTVIPSNSGMNYSSYSWLIIDIDIERKLYYDSERRERQQESHVSLQSRSSAFS